MAAVGFIFIIEWAGERYTTRLMLLLTLPVTRVREVVQKSRCTF